MTKQEKATALEGLCDLLNANDIVYLTDIQGLSAEKTASLRAACFKAGIQLKVVKNTLLAKAMERVEKDYGDIPSVLKGNTSLMIAEKSNAPAKLIKDLRKKGNEKPLLKGAFVEHAVYIGDNQLEALASLKSREELIGDVIGLLQSPAKRVISALQSGGSKLSGIVKTLSERDA